MGYDAYVTCSCYARGLTVPPPTPEFIVSDEDGTYLNPPDALRKADPARFWAMHDAYRAWEDHACPHPHRHAASERVANSGGMYAFRSLVEEQGGVGRFPVLSEQLPEYNGGSMPADLAPALLWELDELAAGPDQVLVMLREQEIENEIYTVRKGRQELFVFTGRGSYQYGLDEDGFFILQEVDGLSSVRFRSVRFVQQRLEPELFSFTDVATGHRFECSYGLRTAAADAATATFELARETLPLARIYASPLAALRTLATAAVATGNPICWC